MEDYYEYLDSNGVTTLYKLIKDDTVALIDSYSVTINGITTNLDNHVNNVDIHTPITTIEGMIDTAVGSLNYATPDYVDTKISGLVNSAPETLDTLKELSDALGNDSNFATTVVNQIGTKASKDDVYTKGETDTLLEGKANSVHSHVVSDITDFPTIPTKTSQLINDSGFLTSSNGLITSVSWSDITNKPSFSDIAISGSYNDLVDTPPIPTKTSDLTNDSGYITSVSWNDVTNKPNFSTVATSGSYNDLSNKPTIPNVYNKTLTIQKNGTNVATFTSNSNTDVTADITVPTKVSELSNDSGFITGISWDKVTNKPTLATVATSGSYTDLSNTPTIPTKVSQLENDMGFGTGGDTSDCVHKTGDEYISGTKLFSNTIHRYGDITTSGGEQVYRFDDTNANGCGHIYNNTHWTGDAIYNRHGAYNAKSGKAMEIDIISNDSGVGMAYVAGTTNKGNLEIVTSDTGHTGIATIGWVNNPATSTNVVHRSGDETISGNKTFNNNVTVCGNLYDKNVQADLTQIPTSNIYTQYRFVDKNNKTMGYVQHVKRTNGIDQLTFIVRDSKNVDHGFWITTDKELLPAGNNTYNLGSSGLKWANVYATTFNGNSVLCTDGNAFMAQNGGYTFLIRNDGSNTYFLMSDKDGTPGTWSTARPLIISNNTGVCSINGNANSANYADAATYATTQATSDNSTKIATTAWVRTYVNSVVGSGSVGASISAYYSNATTKTAEGSETDNNGVYPADYSDYINIAPTVGTIYTGSQLFSSFTPTASGSINKVSTGPSTALYKTTAKATATFSGAFSASAKYLCTTANAVKFRAYVSQGTTSSMGSPSVVDNSSSKSIFIRVQ